MTREQETVSDPSRSPEGPAPLFVARVVTGKDAGKSLVLDWNATPRVLVGQSRVCELVIADPRVSRRHLALSPEGHGVRLTDLGATNGTRIGGLRVIEAVLTGGEVVEIGDTTLRVVRAGNLPDAGTGARDRFGRVLGRSQEMQRLFALCERLASSALPLLIEGETGTGKELLAEAIHDAGPRAGGPLVVFDCSAHPAAEQLPLLFGHGDEGGALEQAMGGTLVLDEIGELGAAAQARIATIERSHGDVRLVSITRRDLEKATDEGTFREALLFRIAGARIEVPPLRKRHGDVELLARHFWALFGGVGELPKTFALQLSRLEWPGNVRELEHAVARRIALGDDLEGALPPARAIGNDGDFLERVLGMGLAMPHARQLVVEEFEQRYVERAIAEHGGNVSRAAAASGLTRRYFHMLRSKRRTTP
ncbi:MAG: sigma 54-dependent Fis family transcriptional regulator [Deltaproteobacteria bacterium]|nr:sigma 54-dependent Fis family transcriptional regulator [Deltaproteobacteria bacterium]